MLQLIKSEPLLSISSSFIYVLFFYHQIHSVSPSVLVRLMKKVFDSVINVPSEHFDMVFYVQFSTNATRFIFKSYGKRLSLVFCSKISTTQSSESTHSLKEKCLTEATLSIYSF